MEKPYFDRVIEGKHATKLGRDLTYRFYSQYEEIAYSPPSTACYVIITCRSLLWVLLTLGSTLTLVASISTPQWLVGHPRPLTQTNPSNATYTETLGIFNRCTFFNRHEKGNHDSCTTYVTGFNMASSQFPDVWKSTLVLFAVATVFLSLTVLTALLSLCVRNICAKSIFTTSGLLQSIAGLFLVVGLILYPLGWSSDRVRSLCGDQAGTFEQGDCTIGWAFYSCMGATVLVFATAILAIQADISTSSDKVENEMLEGKNFICVL